MYYRRQKLTYKIAIPPIKRPFSSMSDAEAQEYFDWVMDVIPERMEYMREVCAKDLGIDKSELDFSPKSLLLLGKWFYMVGKIEKTPKAALRELKKQYSGLPKYWAENWINMSKTQPSLQTEYILRDIGMYFGEVYVRNSRHLFWKLHKGEDVYYNRTVISGFVGGPVAADTVDGARICAIDMMNGKNDTERLYKCYALLHKYIPEAKPLKIIPNWTEEEKKREEYIESIQSFKAYLIKIEYSNDKAILYFDTKDEPTQIECTEKKAQKLIVGQRYNVYAKKGVLQAIAKLKPLKRRKE